MESKTTFETFEIEPDKVSIEEVKWPSNRVIRCLKRIGKETLADIINIESPEELSKNRALGSKTLEEILNTIHDLGLKCKFEIREDEIKAGVIPPNEIHIEEIVSGWTLTSLKKAGIETLADIINIESPEELRRIINYKTFDERYFIEKIHLLGVKFKYEITAAEKLEDAINQIKSSYKELKYKTQGIQNLKDRISINIASIKEKELSTVKDIAQLEIFIQENAEFLKEIGEFDSLQEKLALAQEQKAPDLKESQKVNQQESKGNNFIEL